MRIAFSGSAGTGKSTIAEMTAARFSLPLVPEGVREYLASIGKDSFRDMSSSEMFDMQLHILKTKVDAESNTLDFVADRTTADSMAYTLRWCAKTDTDVLKQYTDQCVSHLITYDMVFFCPWGAIEYKQDGLRSRHIYYQLEMEYLIYGILSSHSVPIHVLSEKTMEGRLKEVAEIIKRIGRYL